MASIQNMTVTLSVDASDVVATLGLLNEASQRLLDYANVLEQDSHKSACYDTRECAKKLMLLGKDIQYTSPKP